jgi:hypothetical protein
MEGKTMYESPINAFYNEMITKVNESFDNGVLEAVTKVGITVDRDELIKALSYDRGQYEKGFSDGLEEGKPKWISVKDRLPEPEQEVLAVCRKRYGLLVVPAIYENGEVDTDDSNWHWYDCDFPYDEENDVYIIPEGWWENRHFNPEDTFNCPIDVPVTHWMPLPEPPKEEK